MSDMSTTVTFTVRDLNRQAAKVLAAVRKFGSADLRTRCGEVFTLSRKANSPAQPPEELVRAFLAAADDRQERMAKMRSACEGSAAFDERQFNRMIAGEE